ncbi:MULTISPECIES: hypothetical protein [Micromonospora]|uniref:Uncharacterized protein n=1 Tax=Micromonospora chalcea TaxID=1874 RepID=A0ABX9XZT0_MICCH|nr:MULTISPECIES: hypothetical protein [Micromonospora]MBC8989405.1 hypothetical protein [Micromonospora chalcea]MBP1781181.1 hypothetical protein [Micromonospora sp. HB375]MBQ1061606.1 hypothetical protein [Micromonospora sp. C41]MBQ1071382.1 hypothetical protein [Micromonospora sp. D75]MCK1807138.1 hypothetical protein [Micromonospora sp. R42106]
MARNEFRFVVDGVDLSAEQQTLIAAEIQKAGLAALRTADAKLTNPLTVGHGNIKLRPEWYGLWVIDGPFAQDLGQKINDIGFWIQR